MLGWSFDCPAKAAVLRALSWELQHNPQCVGQYSMHCISAGCRERHFAAGKQWLALAERPVLADVHQQEELRALDKVRSGQSSVEIEWGE